MGQRVHTSTTVTERIRGALQKVLADGWSSTKIAAEMYDIGHKGWNSTTVTGFAKGMRQSLTIDEGLALSAVISMHAQWLSREIADLMECVEAAAARTGSPQREKLGDQA